MLNVFNVASRQHCEAMSRGFAIEAALALTVAPLRKDPAKVRKCHWR
jgi:hypothetical protein